MDKGIEKRDGKAMALLRQDPYSIETSEGHADYTSDKDDSDIEFFGDEGEYVKAYPAFEAAYNAFIQELAGYEKFYDNDAISSEFLSRINPQNLFNKIFKEFNAEAEAKQLKKHIEKYCSKFENALEELEKMEDSKASGRELNIKEGELFTDIVREFYSSMKDFGEATRLFVIEKIYMKFIPIADRHTERGFDIFGYFEGLGTEPDYMRRVYDRLSADTESN